MTITRETALQMIAEQRRWIERCERNGSYSPDDRGRSIRTADDQELRRRLQILRNA